MEGKVIRYRQRRKRLDLRFYGTVVLVAVIAFSATLFWQSGDVSAVSASARAYDFSCDVSYVNDGDTLRCQDGTRVGEPLLEHFGAQAGFIRRSSDLGGCEHFQVRRGPN